MISHDLAGRLAPYLDWTPHNGDQFFIPRSEIADSVFTVSDMVVELVVRHGESRFHFNGTVEWALDSVESDVVVWLPREEQLRELLGDYFLSLDHSSSGFVVTVSGPGHAQHTEPEAEAEDAYAQALLRVFAASNQPLAAQPAPVGTR
ncbi:MAG TPA: pilus assembly protein CpaE [Propionibacteriaceae bacterium]